MKRINVHLTLKQIAALEERSRATGLPVAELIRRAIDAFLEGGRPEKGRRKKE